MLRINKKLFSFLLFAIISTSFVSLQGIKAIGNVGKLSDSSFYDSNTLHVVGEIINSGDVAIQNVGVKVIFYDSLNQKITTIEGYSDLNVILAGRKSFFSIRLLESEGSLNVQNYTIWFNWTDTAAGKPLGLVVLSSNESIDSDGHMHITGQIQNQGTVNSNNTEVSVTFYNSSGVVVGTSWAFSNPPNLSPNQIGSFDIELIYTPQVAKVQRWSLTAESNALAFSPTALNPSPSPSASASPTQSPFPSITPTLSPSPNTSPTTSTSPNLSPSPTVSNSPNPSASPTSSASLIPSFSPNTSSNPTPTSSALTTQSPLATNSPIPEPTKPSTMLLQLVAVSSILILAAIFILYWMKRRKIVQK